MPIPPSESLVPVRIGPILDTALDQSQAIKAEVKACAEDLGLANGVAQALMAKGVTTLPAAQALRTGVSVEKRVQRCADELQLVTEHLAHGVDAVRAVERTLDQSRLALAKSEAELAEIRQAGGVDRAPPMAHQRNPLGGAEDAATGLSGPLLDPRVQARFETLTPREREVFELLVTGLSSKLIARELGGSYRTIEIHRSQIMRKMAARHLPELVRMSIESLEPRRLGTG